MFNQRTITIIIIVVLAAGLVLSASQCYVSLQNLKAAESLLRTYQQNEKVLSFTKLFIGKVLKAETEVSFEDRLQLENAVRDINNEDILDQWNKFTESKTEAQAQEEVKNLLELLVNKIAY
ncbi:hypothetical protein KKE19_04025 [Patescibacteria group bacterium]|nr:hypothetical protein [Patescibacteria group bacterium]MBU4367869.1 hypothetical protein [Patescibacteria group bacterium]MBU4461954.1 hypothetical protein [Patescibacteria group bacterium]MCG2699897.1 hypothetical protein [Candidatus Parcubacteria bacterium]